MKSDSIHVDARLTDGMTDPQDVLDTYATVTVEGVQLDFGNGDILLLVDVTSLSGLADVIDII